MSSWAARIKSQMKEIDITQEELANKMGITRSAITHYLAGRRVPPLRQFQKLAAILKTDPAWLQFGKVEERNLAAAKAKKEPSTRIPLLGWEQITDKIDSKKIRQDEIKEWVPHFYCNQQLWFALRVKGDAMVSPTGHSKTFMEGNILIINPDQPATHGSFVIALLPRAKEVTFKQYVIDGGVHYLKPLNSQYPTVGIDKSTYICGIVVHCIS